MDFEIYKISPLEGSFLPRFARLVVCTVAESCFEIDILLPA